MNKHIILLLLAFITTSLFGCKKDTAINKTAKLVVYPNPFTNKFNAYVQLAKPQAFTIKLYNVDGVLIKQFNTNSNQLNNNIVIDATPENEGQMYIVAELANETLSTKIIKVKP